jgi:hypothetical protein
MFDVHFGNRMCDVEKFKRYLADGDQLTYYIGGGDLLDTIVVPDKRYSKASDMAPDDSIIDWQVDSMCDILRPYRERIIGLGIGNHEEKMVKMAGTNAMERICKNLGVPYLGMSWLVRLSFREPEGRGRQIIIHGHHGWGGSSRTAGGEITKYSKDLQFWDADLFLYGHGHHRKYDEVPRLSLKGDKLIARPKVLVLCGTFLRTLSDNATPSYSEREGYPPVPIGGVDIYLKPDRTGVKVWTEISAQIQSGA